MSWNKNVLRMILAISIVAAFFGVLAMAIIQGKLSDSLLNVMLGTLASGFMLVLSYYFGSSKSSEDKTELLTKRD